MTDRVKTWNERCQEHPDHEGVVTTRMIMDRMQEEIDELREALDKMPALTEQKIEALRRRIMTEAYNAADDGDTERYNALKLMANDVLEML